MCSSDLSPVKFSLLKAHNPCRLQQNILHPFLNSIDFYQTAIGFLGRHQCIAADIINQPGNALGKAGHQLNSLIGKHLLFQPGLLQVVQETSSSLRGGSP